MPGGHKLAEGPGNGEEHQPGPEPFLQGAELAHILLRPYPWCESRAWPRVLPCPAGLGQAGSPVQLALLQP